MDKTDIFIYILIVGILGICLYMYFDSDAFQLKCIVSSVDGNKYCVREREKVQEAADMLAKITVKCKALVEFTNEHHGEKENVKRLVGGYNPQRVMETLPTSEFTAFSEKKRKK